MGETTNIEWTDHTFNPWIGCTRVSPGCQHCYAETLATTRMGLKWGPGEQRRITGDANWKQLRRWNRNARRDQVRRRVFIASLADVFDNEAPSEARTRLFGEVEECFDLDHLLLTKRPENWERLLPGSWLRSWPSHVRLGFTAEDQTRWDMRYMYARQLFEKYAPTVKLFVSCEPLLGSIEFEESKPPAEIGWIICGGESGTGARPMHPDWARRLLQQSRAAGVPFFFKQWGQWAPWQPTQPDKRVMYVASDGSHGDKGGPADMVWDNAQSVLTSTQPLISIGKKAAGALLDGCEYKEFPALKK